MSNADAAVATMTLQDGLHWTDVMTALAGAVAAVAAFATTIAAFWGILFARQQLRQARDAAKEAAASSILRSLLEKALEYPDFIAPVRSDVDVEKETFKGDQREFRRYEQFVDLMLTTFAEMLKLPIDSATDRYINGWLCDHQPYLRSNYFERRFGTMVSEDLRARIRNACDSTNAVRPATTGSDR